VRSARRSPAKYLVPLGIIPPIALMIGSLVPTWFCARVLAHALGIPDNAPVKDQTFGLLWVVLFLAAGCAFLFIGCWLGMLLDAAILRFALGWSWAAVDESGVCPRSLIPGLWGVKEASSPSEWLDSEDDPMYDPQLDDPGWSRGSRGFRMEGRGSHRHPPPGGPG
jgi:hypothetical protein